MADPQIEKLLIVQDRDIALQRIDLELKRIPGERTSIEKAIEDEEAHIVQAASILKKKEVERSELDLSVKVKEAEITRYRNQQLQVKKNEEYQALTQQIDLCAAEINRLEEAEIGLMLEIDEASAAFSAEKTSLEAKILQHRAEIHKLVELEQILQSSVDAAREALALARSESDPSYLEHYDRVSRLAKRAPYVVAIKEHKCGGCHLRVSNEVSRGAQDAGTPHFCDQCGRMVYA